MSKAIVIHEGGVAKQITADKLKTDLVGGGSCLWVPEDGTRLGTKHISENGTYKASDDGYYGYSEVTVSGVGTATGKDPDGSGDDAQAMVDPQTGDIVITKLPSSISVITPPTNPYGVYTDGQAITKDGMVVKGYFKSGGEWGTVPNNEITLDPANADYSKTSGTRSSEYSEFGQGPWPQPVNSCIGRTTAGAQQGSVYYPEYLTVESPGYIAVRHIGNNNYSILLCSSSPGTGRIGRQIGTSNPLWSSISVNNSYTHNGQTVYYAVTALGYAAASAFDGMNETVNETDLPNDAAAWVVVYGTETQAANAQTITVLWPRPGDGEVLETTFDILVGPTPNSSGG